MYCAVFIKLGSLTVVAFAFVCAQQPLPPGRPGPKPKPPNLQDRLTDIRMKLDSTKPVNATAARALQYAGSFLTSAEQALRSREPFVADRLAEAAGALIHVAEHQQHILSGGGPKGAPPADAIQNHLQRVYFRTQQADYFLGQAHDSRAASFPKWARDFYQLALRAYDRHDLLAADENAKCADEVVKALENLAQAASPPITPPAPPPHPPAPPPPRDKP